MSAPSVKRSPVGFRSATIFALSAAGLPAATSPSVVYEGIVAEGAKTLTINDPEFRRIFHTGDDRVMQIDQLPPMEAATAELHLGRLNDTLEAALTGLKAFVVGEANMFLSGVTDLDGFEPTVGILAYSQALDESGNRVWHSLVMPKAVTALRESGLGETEVDRVYTVTPQLCSKHLWGPAFTTGTEGGLSAQFVRMVTEKRPKIVAFLGDGTTTVFLFPAAAQAYSTGKVSVYVNGVLTTSGVTKAVTGITFSVAPAAAANLTFLYEQA
jgi:hypothetical protein